MLKPKKKIIGRPASCRPRLSSYKVALLKKVQQYVNENKLKTSFVTNTYFVRQKNLSVTITLDTRVKVELLAHNCSGGDEFVVLERTTFKYADKPSLEKVVAAFKKYRNKCKDFY